jgi:hypothetical protein
MSKKDLARLFQRLQRRYGARQSDEYLRGFNEAMIKIKMILSKEIK